MLQAVPFDVSGLCPGILRGIGQGLRLIPSDVLHTEVLEDLEELLRAVVERHSTVMRIALLHQHMTVETTHFVDGEHADAAERAGRDGQHFALRDVGAHHAVRIALQAVERDGAGRDVAFQRAAGEVRIAAGGLQQAVLNQLVLDSAVVAHLAGRRVAAVEAHEGVRQLVIELALDIFECIIFAWIFKAENIIPKLNAKSKSIKLGKWWLVVVKYVLPIFIAIVWVGGILEVISSGSMLELAILAILTIILLGATFIFTKLPAKSGEWDEVKQRL